MSPSAMLQIILTVILYLFGLGALCGLVLMFAQTDDDRNNGRANGENGESDHAWERWGNELARRHPTYQVYDQSPLGLPAPDVNPDGDNARNGRKGDAA